MHDVHPRVMPLGEPQQQRDRGGFRLGGTRRDVLRVAAGDERRRGRRERPRQLAVRHQHCSRGGDRGDRAFELRLADRRELLDPGVHEEALEAEDAGVVEPGYLRELPGHDTAEKADVDRASPERGRAGGAVEAFPGRAAGLVHVHVRVDEAGQDHRVVRIVNGQIGRRAVGAVHRDDHAVANLDRGGAHSRRGHDPPRAEDAIAHAVSFQNWRTRFAATVRR